MKKNFFFIFTMLVLSSCSNSSNEFISSSEVSLSHNNQTIETESYNTGEEDIYQYNEILKLINTEDFEEAERLILEEDFPKDSLIGLELEGRLFFEKGNYQDALDRFLQLNELTEGKDYNVLYMLGVIYDNLGEKEKAKEYIEKSLKINPDFEYATSYLEILNDHINQSVNANEQNDLGTWYHVSALIDEGKFQQASEELQQLDLEKRSALELEGRIAFGLQNYQDALDRFFQLNELTEGKDYNVLYMLGVIYDNLGEKKKSKEYIEKSLKINSDFKYAQEYLSNLEPSE